MNKIIENIERIMSYRNLPDNWNDNGATAPNDNLLVMSIKFLVNFKEDNQPEVFLTASNSVQFEWENNDNYLEIELFDCYLSIYETCKEETIINNDYNIDEFETINYYSSLVDTILSELKRCGKINIE